MDWNDMIGDLNDPESTHGNSTSIPAAVASIDSSLSFDHYLEPSNPLAEWTTLGMGESMERCNSSSSSYGNSIGMDGLNSGMSLVCQKSLIDRHNMRGELPFYEPSR